MADDDNNTGAEETPGPVRKKAAKKKGTRKKATKKVAARTAADSEPTPAEPPRPPQPEAAHHSADVTMHGHGGDDDESSISGWLVMWGPLIIVGFLILIFMGDERSNGSMAAAPPPQSGAVAPQAPAELPAAGHAIEVSPEQAAADLAEAFKAAGIPLPTADPARTEIAPRAPAEPGLPQDLQGNPWAPASGQPAAAAVPPPPGYGHPYGHYPHGGGYPPPGHYPYAAPPPGYYGYGGWGPAPGYGPGYGAMPHAGPGHMGQGHPGMMGPGAGQGHPMMQPTMPMQDAPSSDSKDGAEGAAPPPPSN